MKKLQRITAFLLVIFMLLSFSSCLPDLDFDSDDEDKKKETEAQTSAIEGIEKNLKKLQKNDAVSYQKLGDNEREFEEERLNAQYSMGLDNSIQKAYSVEQNEEILKIYEFKKTSDAKTLEGLLKQSIQNGEFGQDMKVVRKNNVILLGNSTLIDLITSGKSSSSNETKPAATTGPKEPNEELDERGFLKDDLPENLKFNQTVRLLGWDVYTSQYYLSEFDYYNSSGDAISKAVYQRGATVEDRLGIEMVWTFVHGDWGSRETFIKEVETSCQKDPYYAMICYNLMPSLLATKGYTANLYNSEYLDLSAPWWPQAYTNEMLINETIYGIPESNDYGLLRNMMAIFFNIDLLEARGMPDPYDLVVNDNWNMATFSELIRDTHEDRNNTTGNPYDDIYGFVNATHAKRDAWLYALGFRFVDVQDGEAVSMLDSPDLLTYVDTMVEFYASGNALINDKQQNQIFLEEHAYFYGAAMLTTETIKKTTLKTNYGFVPYPKLDTAQSRYYTHVANTYDAWCVPFNTYDMDLSSALLECMASESYRQIGPAYYNHFVKNRFVEDEKQAPMYDLIRDSVTFDLAYLYYPAFLTNILPKDQIKNCIKDPQKYAWSSAYSSNKDTWQTAFNDLLAVYQY